MGPPKRSCSNAIMLVTPRLPGGRGPSRKPIWRAGRNTAFPVWRGHRKIGTTSCRVPRLASSMMEPGGGSGSEQTAPPGGERWAQRVPVKLAAELKSVRCATAEDRMARALRKTPERLHWAVAGGLVRPP
jgi:hypothetical protein